MYGSITLTHPGNGEWRSVQSFASSLDFFSQLSTFYFPPPIHFFFLCTFLNLFSTFTNLSLCLISILSIFSLSLNVYCREISLLNILAVSLPVCVENYNTLIITASDFSVNREAVKLKPVVLPGCSVKRIAVLTDKLVAIFYKGEQISISLPHLFVFFCLPVAKRQSHI